MKIDPSRLNKMFEEVNALYEAECQTAVLTERQEDEFTTREYTAWLHEQGERLGERAVLKRLEKLLVGKRVIRRKMRGAWFWKMVKA